jgi:hypothetical protein
MRAVVLLTAVLAALSGPPAFAARDGFEHWQLAAREDRGGKAERRQDQSESDRGSRRGGRDRDQAVRRAQREYGGRVLSVDRMPGDEQQRERYRIKLLSEGNVRTVDVEAEEDD